MGRPRNKHQKKATRNDFRKDRNFRRDVESGAEHASQDKGKDRLSSLNDISWYSRYPQLVETASRFPYTIKPGSNYNLGTIGIPGTSPLTEQAATMNVPGILELDWRPSVGMSSTATDPASIVARELYSRVRSKFSSSLDVDPPDFLMYVMALDSIFSYIGALKRIYRLLMAYTPDNFNIPELVLASLGVPQQVTVALLSNKADFLQSINELVYMSRRFTCPATMDIFNRHYWMNDNVYTDAPTIGSQMYVFFQTHYFQYSVQKTPDNVDASGLNQIAFPTLSTNPADAVNVLFQFGKTLLDTLSGWDDAYTINGYLMRAYEGVPNFVVDILDANEQFAPVYVEEVLVQIENSKTVWFPGNTTMGNITVSQDPKTNTVISKPILAIPKSDAQCYTRIDPWLSMRQPNPTWQENVIATRLTAFVEYDSSNNTNMYPIVAGTEIPVRWRLWWYDYDWETNDHKVIVESLFQTMVSLASGLTSNSTLGDKLVAALRTTAFDWHPQFFMSVGYGSGLRGASIVGDTHYLSVLNRDALKNLHRICVYSEFNAFSE